MDSKITVRKVNLKQYRSVDGRWQFVPVVKVNGRPRPQLVLINERPVSSKGGTFYLEWRENGKRKTRPVGTSPRDALSAWQLQMNVLSGNIEAPEEVLDDLAGKAGATIDVAISRYLLEVKATKSPATLLAYSKDLRWFRQHCKKHYVTQLNRGDVMALFAAGRDQGLNQKTVNKRVIVMLQAMRGAGAIIALKKGDWPKTVEKQVQIYEPEELKRFFVTCNPAELALFQLFLCTGFRAQEVATLVREDVNWKTGTVSVRGKPELQFTPKSYEERSVPVPGVLLDKLRERRKANKDSLLLFPSPPHPKRPDYGGNKPDAHLLETCKSIAYRAGLNCGKCKTKKGLCKFGPHCKAWHLHKWRHTYATNMLQSGVDIRSLQVLLGHKNIATTEKYLKSLRLDNLRDKIEQSTLSALLQAADQI